MRHRILVGFVVAVVLALCAPAAGAAPTYDEAVDQLLGDGYPQQLETWLTAQGSSPIGMAFGGSTADNARAEYLAAELKKLGYRVKLEAVPLDATEFKGASVIADGATYVASTFGGVAATPPGGITAPLVYVGGATAAEIAAAGNLDGKIAIVDALLTSYWMNWQWTEAALADAEGIIYTGVPSDSAYYAEPTSLGSFDAEYRHTLAPVVYISQADGTALKAALAAHPDLTAKMVNDVEITLKEDGGHGYNVVATLPGSRPNAGRIVVAAHHDAYFHAGIDDTGGCVAGMLMAAAMKASDYKPTRSVTFLFTTGEEYGAVDAYYDWLIGAWHAITQRHPSWAGSTAIMLNLESMAMDEALMETRATPEVKGIIDAAVAARPELAPFGHNIKAVNCWNDQWTFTAAGVPSMYFRARTPEYGYRWYHTNYDTIALMDYEYLAKITKLVGGIAQQFDKGLLPYDIAARAAELDANVDGTALKEAGAGPKRADRLEAAVARFVARADSYMARAPEIKGGDRSSANVRLLKLEKKINKAFTALDAWDSTVYPHAQVQWDLEQINAALAALQADPVDKAGALAALEGVGITDPYGLDFSHENYVMQLAMHAKGWEGGLFWGAQGHLSPYLDVVPVMAQVDGDDVAGAIASLETMRMAEVKELNKRIVAMTAKLAGINGMLRAIR
jgi:hypothetical protein